MTNPFGIDHDVYQAATNQIRDIFAEMAFQLAAQSTLGALLRGEPHDQTHTRLNARPTHQLERINRAARELTTLTDGILEDREAATDDGQVTHELRSQPCCCPLHGDRSSSASRDVAGGES